MMLSKSLIDRAVRGYQVSPHSSSNAYHLTGAITDALRAAFTPPPLPIYPDTPEPTYQGALINRICIDTVDGIDVEVVRNRQPDGSPLWSVKRLEFVLNCHGVWEYEQFPSQRDAEYKLRCRFVSIDHACYMYRHAKALDAPK